MAEDAGKRSSRACDACKVKRIKCDNFQGEDSNKRSCGGCRDIGQFCTFEAPVRKRGPAVGFKRRRRSRSSIDHTRQSGHSSTPPSRDPADSIIPDSARPVDSLESHAYVSRQRVPTHSPTQPKRLESGRDVPLLGLPRPMIDELLAAYFTHVHNVWPLIYKPAFTPYNVSPLLLLSMLAISACVSPPSSTTGYDARKLYRMAESALHRSRAENRIDVVQALILLSLTQTGCGDKGAAFIYASRAVGMILNMGLNLARKYDGTSVDEQTRSRVLWNCYVLDKSLAEETGRSYLLPYRRCSTPFPSLDEMDELEVWPPASTSSALLPQCVRRLTPRRGHVISCFVWTCRLAMVVEDILDLDPASQPGNDEWDRQFRQSKSVKQGNDNDEQEAARIGEQLGLWRQMLPVYLTPNDQLSPLPHHVIGLAWHATATIMLHSRFVVRIPSTSTIPSTPSDWASRAHTTCSNAARQTVNMLRSLDEHGLLDQISSDAIHILSLATLFEAFDMANPDGQAAARAKEDFTQCCAWLRHFSSMWPAASAHKLFFEAVFQGGLKLSDPEAGNEDRASPLRNTASLLSPSLTGGLQAVRRHLSVSHALDARPVMPLADGSLAGPSGMLQIPHFFWNHLSTATAMGSNSVEDSDCNGQNMAWDDLFNFEDPTIETGLLSSGQIGDGRASAEIHPAQSWAFPTAAAHMYAPGPASQRVGTADEIRSDQAAISAALMSFMADMTKGVPP